MDENETEDEPVICAECKARYGKEYVEGSFACKIRHQGVLTGNTEAKKHDQYLAGVKQESIYGI